MVNRTQTHFVVIDPMYSNPRVWGEQNIENAGTEDELRSSSIPEIEINSGATEYVDKVDTLDTLVYFNYLKTFVITVTP